MVNLAPKSRETLRSSRWNCSDPTPWGAFTGLRPGLPRSGQLNGSVYLNRLKVNRADGDHVGFI